MRGHAEGVKWPCEACLTYSGGGVIMEQNSALFFNVLGVIVAAFYFVQNMGVA